MEKKVLRNVIKEKLKQLSEANHFRFSQTIKDRLVKKQEWVEAQTVGITISTNKEVDTFEIIKAGWEEKKRIVVPKCYPKTRELKFYEIKSFDELEDSFYSLKEPIVSLTPFVSKEEIDLLIVPGLVFDKRGYRIGYGGGYYDRFLVDYLNHKISLAFSFQLIDEVPIEAHDLLVEYIITNT